MIETIAKIFFYALMLLFAGYGAIMIYVLLRYAQSKILGFIVSGLFVVIMLSLFAAAYQNFFTIPFDRFTL